ncbi:MAG: hypothetical protein AMXMBFR83_07390 [Phycisphaerae bacterium]
MPAGSRPAGRVAGTATRTTDISHVPAQVTAGAPLPIKPAIPRTAGRQQSDTVNG